jgi:hypothetical protein
MLSCYGSSVIPAFTNDIDLRLALVDHRGPSGSTRVAVVAVIGWSGAR